MESDISTYSGPGTGRPTTASELLFQVSLLMQTSTLSPTSASSPTLIATPFPKVPSDRCAPPFLQLHPPTANGFLQPHRNNLPRRPSKKKRAPPPPPSSCSSSPSILVAECSSERSQSILGSTWSQAACLQEISHGSGVYVAFSRDELSISSGSELSDNHPALLGISLPASLSDGSSIDEERPSSDDNAPHTTSTRPASYSQDTLHPDLSEFTAVVQIYHNETRRPPKDSISRKPIHEIYMSAHSRDDGTPNLTCDHFSNVCAFFRPFIRPPPASSDGPHSRHRTASAAPASSQPNSKVLILSPKSHAPDALSLAAGLVCYYDLRLGRSVSRTSEGGVEVLEEIDTIATEDDRVTAVHALFMRLHDYEHDIDDDGQGLRDEWRGVVSRCGMDVIGSWMC